MKYLFATLLTALLSACLSLPQKSLPPDAKTVAIIGASVSAGFGAYSPGEIAAANMGMKSSKYAGLGRWSSLSRLVDSLPNEAYASNALISVDGLFWDSFTADCSTGIAAAKTLIDRKGAQSTIIIGNIPQIDVSFFIRFFAGAPHTQSCRNLINAELPKLCAAPGCLILDVDRFINVHRREMPDGLHLSNALSALMADEIIGLLRANR